MKVFALTVLSVPSVLAGFAGAPPAMAATAAQLPVVAVAQSQRYADGTYTGPAASAYYGNVQLQVTIKNGQVVGFSLLDYPRHTSTSEAINRQALPMLAQEVLTAQSASVNVVSGATLSSEAFAQSVGGALAEASAAMSAGK